MRTKKILLIAACSLAAHITNGQDSSALINKNWRSITGDTTLTYPQITYRCDSLFALAGYPPPPDTAQGSQENELDGRPYYDYCNWKSFFSTRLDAATLKPHNFLAGVTSASGLPASNCVGDIAFIETVEKDITINTAAWAKGLYIVKWQGADGTVLVSKLIIN